MQDLRLDWGAAPQGPRRATELCDAAAAATAARRGDAGEKERGYRRKTTSW